MNTIDLLPPAILKLAKKLKGLEAKEYPDYKLASAACTSAAYQNEELCNVIADKTLIYSRDIIKKPLSLNPTQVFLLSAITQYLNTSAKRSINVLDFGGACGAHYFEIKRFLPGNISLNWFVVETERMVASALEKGINTNELSFVSSIEDIKEDIDFIHSSGALQYVPDPYLFLRKLCSLNAQQILLNRMMFNQNDRDIVSVQKSHLSSNGHGALPKGYTDRIISYPHTTMSFSRFNLTISEGGYDLEWQFNEPSGSYRIGKEKIIGLGLFYVKRL